MGRSVIFMILNFLIVAVYGQQQEILLIPQPQKVTLHKGTFPINKRLNLYPGKLTNEKDLYSALQLVEEFQAAGTFAPVIEPKVAGAKILFNRIGIDNEIEAFKGNKIIGISKIIGNQGYYLTITPQKIYLAANTGTGIFYGVQTLKQLIRQCSNFELPCLEIIDFPKMKYRGWLNDICGESVPSIPFIKKQIKVLSSYKMNVFTLYNENSIELSSYPDLNNKSLFSIEEIKDIQQYAEKHHIELIGNQQCYANLQEILSNPFYRSYGIDNSILDPKNKDSQLFIRNILDELAPVFDSNLFQANFNQESLFKSNTESHKQFIQSFVPHLNYIDSILQSHNKRTLIWGNTLFANPQLIEKIPGNIIVMLYGYDPNNTYKKIIEPFVDQGLDFFVAAGSFDVNRLFPNTNKALVAISNLAFSAQKYRGIGLINMMDYNHGDGFFNKMWYTTCWSANCSWSQASIMNSGSNPGDFYNKIERYNKAFEKLFYGASEGSGSITQLYSDFNAICNKQIRGCMTDASFWESPISFFEEALELNYYRNNKQLIDRAKRLRTLFELQKDEIKYHKETIDNIIFELDRAIFSSKKNIAKIKLNRAYQSQEPFTIKDAQIACEELLKELQKIKLEHIKLWNREKRDKNIREVLKQYDELGNEILNCDKKVFILPKSDDEDKSFKIELRTLFNNQPIYYSINSSDPDTRTIKYEGPIVVNQNVNIKARVIAGGQLYNVSEKQFFIHKAINKQERLNSTYSRFHPSYAAGGNNALCNGVKGSFNYRDGHWQGFQGQDLDVVIDFDKTESLNNLSIDFLNNIDFWIMPPSSIEIYKSNDGKTFYHWKSTPLETLKYTRGTSIYNAKVDLSGLSTRYIKVVAKSAGKIPGWHFAAGNPSFIFADEIIVH
ncbi:hypothetical protein EYV94_16170 [Puteibacter caeruleilacunae]|nr:hypothetical protein EYV94_16170 [Puteibacter caeruleilacunae]